MPGINNNDITQESHFRSVSGARVKAPGWERCGRRRASRTEAAPRNRSRHTLTERFATGLDEVLPPTVVDFHPAVGAIPFI
jgi:hypothetical protein